MSVDQKPCKWEGDSDGSHKQEDEATKSKFSISKTASANSVLAPVAVMATINCHFSLGRRGNVAAVEEEEAFSG